MSFLTDILQQYVGGGQQADAESHFGEVAGNVPTDVLTKGLSAAFNSDSTPAVGDMVSPMFGQSNPTQQAGMLNQILASAGPALIAALAGGALGHVLKPGATQSVPQLTPEQASQLSPDQVKDIVATAQQHNPGIVDQLSAFYAQHTSLVKTLGGAALAITLAKIANSMKSSS